VNNALVAVERMENAWVAGFADPLPNSEINPSTEAARTSDKLVEKYAGFERLAVSSAQHVG
jgi:hypothetical protein